MRLCLVCPKSQPLASSGLDRYPGAIARAWIAAGHEVHVIVGPEWSDADLPQGAHVHGVDMSCGPVALSEFPTEAMRYSLAVYTYLKVLHGHSRYAYIEFPAADGAGYFAIQAKQTLGWFGSAVLGVRAALPSPVRRDLSGDCWFDSAAAYADHIEAASVRGADLVIASSESALSRWWDAHSALPEHEGTGRVETVVRWAAPVGPSESPQAAAGPPVILFSGPVEAASGAFDLAAAANRLFASGVHARIRCIGPEGAWGLTRRPAREHLLTLIAPEWRSRISFEPDAQRRELDDAVRTAAVVCAPATEDGLSPVHLGAAGAGTIVVAADTKDARAALGHSAGLLFAAGDPDDLARALTLALTASADRPCTSDAARQSIAERCSPAVAVAAIERAIADAAPLRSEAVDSPGPPSRPSAVGVGVRDTPDVSVIIPNHNLGAYLLDAVESIRRQTYDAFEIIIVDDGSDDPETLAVLDRLQGTDPRLRIERTRNAGLPAARNHGARVARARLLLPIDADDLASPNLIACGMRALERNPWAAAASPLIQMFNQTPDHPFGVAIPVGLDDTAPLQAVANFAGSVGGAIIRREAWEAAGGFDESLIGLEDWEFWCRLADRGLRTTVIPEVLYYYRVRPDSKFRSETADRFSWIKSFIIKAHPRLASSELALRLQFSELHTIRDHFRWSELARAKAESDLRAADARQRELLELVASQERERQLHAAKIDSLSTGLAAAREENLALADLARSLSDRTREGERQAERAAELEGLLSSQWAQMDVLGQAVHDLRLTIEAHDCGRHTQSVISQNIRYRAADRVNTLLRGTKLRAAVKALARRAVGPGGEP